MRNRSAYFIINLSFVILLSLLFIYVWLLGNKTGIHIPSISSQCQGQPLYLCKSRGLTRDFISIIHQGFSVHTINPYSKTIVGFFLFGWISRVILTLVSYHFNLKWLIVIDVLLLTSFFLYAFVPLLWL